MTAVKILKRQGAWAGMPISLSNPSDKKGHLRSVLLRAHFRGGRRHSHKSKFVIVIPINTRKNLWYNIIMGLKPEEIKTFYNNKDRIATPVDRIADLLYRDTIGNRIHPLENSNLYEYLGNLTEAEREKLFKRHIFPLTLYNRVKNIFNGHSPVAFHPGIWTRLADFESFLNSVNNHGLDDPIATILQFSNHLGKTKVFRLLALTVDEAKNASEHGIRASAFLTLSNGVESLTELLNPYSTNQFGAKAAHSFSEDAFFRLTDMGDKLKLVTMSVSSERLIAESVGWQDSHRKELPSVQPYLFELDVPVLHTLSIKELMGEDRNPTGVCIGDQTINSQGKESFIPFYIDPTYITGMTEIPKPRPYSII